MTEVSEAYLANLEVNVGSGRPVKKSLRYTVYVVDRNEPSMLGTGFPDNMEVINSGLTQLGAYRSALSFANNRRAAWSEYLRAKNQVTR